MHFLADQAASSVPSLSVCTQVVGINNAQPSYALDIVGDINLSGDVRIGGTVQSFGGGTPVTGRREFGFNPGRCTLG